MSTIGDVEHDIGAAAPATPATAPWQGSLDVLLVLGVIALLWEGLHLYAGNVAITSPLGTFEFAGHLLGEEKFWGHLTSTLSTFALSILIAAVGGVLIGALLGLYRSAAQLCEPLLVALYSIPKVTLYPVILLTFGLGMSAKVAFGVLHGIIPMIIFTMDAIRGLKPSYLRTAAVLRLPLATTLTTIIMPAALPEIVSGLRVGLSVTVLGVLVGEMFSSKQGLGFLIMNAISLSDVDTMMAVALILFVLAASANALLLMLDRRLHRRV